MMTLHKFTGPNGFRRIDHMREMMAQRIDLTEKFGEDSGTNPQQPVPGGSNFDRQGHDNPGAVESLRREAARYVGSAAIPKPAEVIVVPYDGTEDAGTIQATRPEHPPTSAERASLPA
jgi:hypothetical protein